jgi:RNA methyltransferase, TrmH family
MISKNKMKYLRSLEHKKIRRTEDVFVAEGPKIVNDLLQLTNAIQIIATNEWLTKNDVYEAEIIEVTDEELSKVSFLQHPQHVIGIFPIPHPSLQLSTLNQKLCIALDGVQDPGNIGTIIRLADWFGITDIICSLDTADVFNPKVVQATMGSIARINIYYEDLTSILNSLPSDTPVYGTLLDGNNIYNEQLSDHGIIIMGNEGNGISKEIKEKINKKLLIPNYPPERNTADSLNVAIATAIICAEFRRRT